LHQRYCIEVNHYLGDEIGEASYKVTWIDTTSIDVQERCQILIHFTYTDNVWCGILFIDVGHTILGRSWLFDLDVTIYGHTNQCLSVHNDKKMKLMPNQPKSQTQEKNIDKGKGKMDALTPEKKSDKGKGKMVMNLISHDQIKKSLNEGSTCYALVAREAEPKIKVQISRHIKPLVEEFSEILPKDLPGELPLMRDI